ncbi:MAG: hypothetical protein QCH35_00755 [Methanomicrobiaceae archaeon]|nr:hypothetical protein [Methanomicrobiaceae archaeon]
MTLRALALLILVCIPPGIPCGLCASLDIPAVEELNEALGPEQAAIYLLPGLQEGQTVYVYAEGVSGNLDPFAAIAPPDTPPGLRANFDAEVEQAIEEGRDPLQVVPEFSDRYFLAWDDDGGEGYDAAFQYTVPDKGDYILIVTNSPAKSETFGRFRLLVGIDAPQVLAGDAAPTGERIAVLNQEASQIDVGVQEVRGNLTAGQASWQYFLYPVEEGDVFYAYIEVTSGNLVPMLILTDFGDKPLAKGIPANRTQGARLQHTFGDTCCNNILEIVDVFGGSTLRQYRLLVGLNEPEVLTGSAEPGGEPVLREPIVVKVGFQLDQITGVDQKSENFGVVGNIWMEWTDPELAFSPDECNCNYKLYRSIDEFLKAEGTRWPEFTLFNQQERRWTQNLLIRVTPDGTATYFERFWVTLQAPDFNFREYPFDEQQFYVRIDSIYAETFFVYTPWEERTAVGSQLGEEEWYITAYNTTIDQVNLTNVNSRYSFGFLAQRHLEFYILRILIPIGIIIVLTYIPFLLKDYGKRADIASANLLLFIAFNFTIANDLPRLGYLTLLDSLLVTTFVISGLTVVYNLYLKWLATQEQMEIAERVDRIMIWLYPLAYILAIVVILHVF